MPSVYQTDALDLVTALHKACLPGDELDLKGQLWLAASDRGFPIGFCSARKLARENAIFLSRAGVLPLANGQGLQRRMINARVRWGRKIGAERAVTYTVYDNHASIANLLRCGFRFYTPEWPWAGDVHYFCKDL